jgi:Zn-dependent protease with chaperone function
VVTDELVALLADREDMLLGVLGHEIGHVQHRHGMRMLIQATLLGAVSSAVWGDFSSLLALAPVVLGQSAYSRDFERQADESAIAFLRANHLSPNVMADFFERLVAKQRADQTSDQSKNTSKKASLLGIALASHPADAQRIERFRQAASEHH